MPSPFAKNLPESFLAWGDMVFKHRAGPKPRNHAEPANPVVYHLSSCSCITSFLFFEKKTKRSGNQDLWSLLYLNMLTLWNQRSITQRLGNQLGTQKNVGFAALRHPRFVQSPHLAWRSGEAGDGSRPILTIWLGEIKWNQHPFTSYFSGTKWVPLHFLTVIFGGQTTMRNVPLLGSPLIKFGRSGLAMPSESVMPCGVFKFFEINGKSTNIGFTLHLLLIGAGWNYNLLVISHWIFGYLAMWGFCFSCSIRPPPPPPPPPQHHQHNTINIASSTQRHQHNTINTTPSTQHRLHNIVYTTPSTQHHQHSIINTTPSTQHHQHSIINTTPSTQHHQHNTINTTPSTQHHQHDTIKTTP